MNYLPLNDGLSSGVWCQQREIHFLANNTISAGPVISCNGGRCPSIITDFITSLVTGNTHPTYNRLHMYVLASDIQYAMLQ